MTNNQSRLPPRAVQPNKLVWIGTATAAAVITAIAAYVECTGIGSSRGIRIYDSDTWASKFVVWGSATGAVLACFCILFGIHFLRTGDSDNATLWGANVRTWKAAFIALWIVLPPAWFCTEYFYVYTPLAVTEKDVGSDRYKDQREKRKEHFEEFTHGQDNASKAWLAMITVLAGLYVGPSLKDQLK